LVPAVSNCMSQPSSNVHGTNLAAAQQALRTAIRMFFSDADDAAIHAMASAAYRVISDVQSKRDVEAATNLYLTSVFESVQAYRRGDLAKGLSQDPGLSYRPVVMSELVPTDPGTTFDDFRKALRRHPLAEAIRHKARAPKVGIDAVRSAGAQNTECEFDTYSLLMQSIVAYTKLVRRELDPEGIVLRIYGSVWEDDIQQLREALHPVAHRILEASPNERHATCVALIDELSVRNSAGDASVFSHD